MLKPSERIVLYYDMTISSWSRESNITIPRSALSLFKLIKAMIDENADFAIGKKSKKDMLYLADLTIDEKKGHVGLLVSRLDKNAPDAVYRDFDTKVAKHHEKTDNQGLDTSAHVYIGLKSLPDKPNTYLLLLEQQNAIPSVRIQTLLNNIFRQCAKHYPAEFEVSHPDGSKDGQADRKLKYRSKVELCGHVSDELFEDIKHGKFLDIELVTHQKPKVEWDDYQHAVELTHTVQIKVKSDDTGFDPIKTLKSITKNAANKKYEHARIRFKNRENTNRSVTMDTATNTLASDSKYVKKAKINKIESIAKTGYDKIEDAIFKKLIGLSGS